MTFDLLDDYLLGGPASKASVIAALLAERSTAPGAAPFYRALEAVGPRVADEALMALRLVLGGRPADDDGVARLRELIRRVRAGGPESEAARQAYALELEAGGRPEDGFW
ncbi:MAG: hypothetical protein NVS1B14_06540 [Vulcanimicrobiaceae bacterium]